MNKKILFLTLMLFAGISASEAQEFFSTTFKKGTPVHISNNRDKAFAIKAGEPIDYISFKNRLIFKRYELEHKYALTFNELDKSSRTYLQKTYEYLESGIYRLENYLKEHPTYEVVGTYAC